MPPQRPHRGFASGRLARRLFALFVAAAVLPLALSGWLSSTAVTQIAEDLNLRSRALTARQTSRQVLDRLLAAKALLAATPPSAPMGAADASSRRAQMQSLGRVFRNLELLHDDQQTAWSTDPAADLAGAWAAAERVVKPSRPLPGSIAADGVGVDLRIAEFAGQPPRALLATRYGGTVRWIAELNPDYLWAPLTEARDDSAWTVLDVRGRTLMQLQGADFPASRQHAAADGVGDRMVEVRSALFLDGEFGADDWVFVQRGPRPQVQWHGQLLAVWLGLVAVGTLLAVALMSQRQIRRTLAPLEELTEGTRQLAAGAGSTRVAIHRDDEIGTLAGAFNDMASHIEAQFDTLEGLAAIDRDILAGVPIPGLAERVLQQLAALYPGARAVVSWESGDRDLMQARLEHHTGMLVAEVTPAWSAPQAAAYQRLAQDQQRRVDEACALAGSADEPWLPSPGWRGTRHVALLPLREGARTRALVAMVSPTALEPQQLQPARELRDRLAVAFAARAREQELVYRAAHDSLTGLTNRYGLHSQLDVVLGGATEAVQAAMLFLDLDHFKDVNDSRGHDAGDELLRRAAARLQACVPAGAILARQGGDEFAIVLPQADEAAACAVASGAIDALRQVFRLQGSEHVLGASVGIALSPDHGRSREELMRCADVALYAAKAAGRGQFRVFSTALDVDARQRVQLLAELRHALERSEFVVHYQPRVRAQDGVICSAEALVRWQHPLHGLLFPDGFIGLAEESGLIDGIGLAVLDAACAQIAAWHRQGVQIQRVSVNVSPQQLASGELPGQVRAALQRHALPGSALEIEVTESLLVGDVRAASAQLAELRTWGVTIAMDDFGTGYSSMATLRQLPIDVMKIDRSFVTDLVTDEGAMAVARAIVTLARSMNLHLVAEGIETESQAAVLRNMGCDELQGYLFAKPVSPEAFVQLRGLQRTLADHTGERAIGRSQATPVRDGVSRVAEPTQA